MWHIQYARTYLNIPHIDNQSKTCEGFKICPGTFPYLFLFTLVLEEIYVNVSAGLFGCIVEDAELRTHEETTIVEHPAVVLCTNLHPLPAIEAVKEGKLNVTFECNPGQGPKAAELIQRLESDISIDKEQYVEETYFDGTMDLDEIIENRTY